jgi:hypothetical protein
LPHRSGRVEAPPTPPAWGRRSTARSIIIATQQGSHSGNQKQQEQSSGSSSRSQQGGSHGDKPSGNQAGSQGQTRGGSSEQHAQAGRQSHKNSR